MSNPLTPAEVTAWLRENQAATQRLIAHWEGLEPSSTHSTLVEFKASLVKYASAADLIESLGRERDEALQQVDKLRGILEMANNTAKRRGEERDGLAGMVLAKDEALRAVDTAVEKLHDDWLEPESWNSAACGQAAAACVNISFGIDAATALTQTAVVAQVEKWRECREILAQLLRVAPDTKEEFELIKRGSQLTGAEAWPQSKPAKEAENAN